ncbi:hypothetical protein MKW94_009448 [Papaver nudicaule]|uniref:Sm domain-containing protein n=1 Tax=Papaver nudicaule TaxID=74823 RepID=A0AA42B081_PAPNU|nr:hypothetical protein [Papaver nudicaule]
MHLNCLFISLYLIEYIDEKLLVLLRDGRKIMGLLRSFDQFGMLSVSLLWKFCVLCTSNAVLESACEQVIVGDLYCDIPLGLYDLEKEELPKHMTRVSPAEIKRAQKAERDSTDLKGSMRKRMEFPEMD